MNKDSVMKTRRLNKIYVQNDKQLQASNVIFLICDTKFLIVAAVLRLSCKEFHIFWTVHSTVTESILRHVCS